MASSGAGRKPPASAENRSSNGTSRIRRVSETGTSLGRLLDCSELDKVPVGDAPGRKAAQSRNSVVLWRVPRNG
jgi:hypothetical protein